MQETTPSNPSAAAEIASAAKVPTVWPQRDVQEG